MISNQNLQKNILYFILGVLAFSSFSSFILLEVLNLPFFFIELYFLPLLLIKKKIILKRINNILTKRALWFSCIILLFIGSFLIGIVYTRGDIINVVTMIRSPFYILIMTFLFSETSTFSIDKLYSIAYGAIIGDFMFALFVSTSVTSSTNLIAIALIIFIPIVKGEMAQSIVSIILTMIVSINSGHRIGIVLVIICLITGFIWILVSKNAWKETKRNIYRSMYIPFFIVSGVIVTSNYQKIVLIVADILNMDQFAIYRVTDRLTNLLSGEFSESQDVGRIEKYITIINNAWIVPKGPVGRSFNSLGDYIDVPASFVFDIFGLAVGLLIISLIFVKGIKAFIKAFNESTDLTTITCGLMFVTYIFLFIINGRFLYITYESLLTGLIFGNWFSNGKYKPLEFQAIKIEKEITT